MNDEPAQKSDDRSASNSNALLAQLGLKIGDYCHAHRWRDKDPKDPFAVGFLKNVLINRNGVYFALDGDGVPERFFPHCEKITQEEGTALLAR